MDLTPREKRIYTRLAKVFAPYLQSVPEAILSGQGFDISELPSELQAALVSELQAFYLADTEDIRQRDKLPDYHHDIIGSAAAEWARNSTFKVVEDLQDNTKRLVRKVVSAAQETPGITLEDMTRMLEPAFGERRAQVIAITETTRASAAAVNGLQSYYKDNGLNYQRQWITNRDEIADNCPVCGPLNGKDESQWGSRFPDGPPAHPNCRCSVVLKRARGQRPKPAQVTQPDEQMLLTQRIDAANKQAASIRSELTTMDQATIYNEYKKKLDVISDKIDSITDQMLAFTPQIIAAEDAGDTTLVNEIRARRARLDAERDKLYERKARIMKQYSTDSNPKNATRRARKLLHASNPKPFRIGLFVGTSSGKMFSQKAKKRITAVAEDFYQMVSSNTNVYNSPGVVRLEDNERAHASPDDGKIHITQDQQDRVIVHELGHIFERNPKILRSAVEFLEQRTAGESPVKLSDLTGNSSYRDDEITKPDRFYRPYVGKQYKDDQGNIEYTEIISMGVEMMYANPVQFAQDDPDHFDYIYRVLRGVYD